MLVYICGKITEIEKSVYTKKFNEAEAYLKALGHEVANPLVFTKEIDENDYQKIMGKCVEVLLGCDEIYILKDWVSSRGAKAEFHIANIYGISVVFQEG